MSYLKLDSTPATQERRMQTACQIIAERARKSSAANKKSYVITSRGFDDGPELPFFGRHPIRRG